MSKLAINGGKKLREKPFPAYNTIGSEEKEAVLGVLESGKLSSFLGTWHNDFYGGKQVQRLEAAWAEYFGVAHAISVNSATSGLYCAVGAVKISPGDEVIVSPYTMTASAVAVVVYGGIPVFADIEEDTFCLSPESIQEKITDKTKAIIVVDIFGQPYDRKKINKIAQENGLAVIEDAAQAPGVKLNNQYAGTLGDIGIYSLNYHKHIHCGEGGVIVTNDEELAFRLKLIRNHAEAAIAVKGYSDRSELINLVGFNYRMTEIDAAIAQAQLRKLELLIEKRIENANYFNDKLGDLPCVVPTKVREGASHAYYVHPLKYENAGEELDRNTFIKAVQAELPPTLLREDAETLLTCGYVKPLYLQPMYQERIAFGADGYPFSLSERRYAKGDCPVTERMYSDELFYHEYIAPTMTQDDRNDVVAAFQKVWEHRHELATGVR